MTEWPTAKYVLLSEAYMPRAPGLDSEVLPTGTEVLWTGKPGPHMQPMDSAGAAAIERAGPQTLNPFGFVPLTGASEDDALAERIAVAVATAMAKAGIGVAQPPASSVAAPAPALVPAEPAVMQAVAVNAPVTATPAAPPPPPPPPPPPKAK